MKLQSKFCLAAVLFAILPFSAFAAQMQKKDITLSEQAQVGSTQLKPEDYQFEVGKNSTGTNNVTFYRDGKAVATAPAQIVDQKNTDQDFETNMANGQNLIDRVYTSKETLKFGSPTEGD